MPRRVLSLSPASLYRRGVVEFDQEDALGALTIHWTGTRECLDIDVDDYAGVDGTDAAPASSRSGARSESEGDSGDE